MICVCVRACVFCVSKLVCSYSLEQATYTFHQESVKMKDDQQKGPLHDGDVRT